MHVPAEQVIGPPGAWVRDDPRTFTLAFAANHAGLARAALDFAIEWVRARPYLADSDLVQAALGTLAAQVQGARSAVMAAAATWDAGRWQRAEAESLMAVHLAKRAALDATRQAFDICGARTSFRTFPLESLVSRRAHADAARPRRRPDARARAWSAARRLVREGRARHLGAALAQRLRAGPQSRSSTT